MYFTNSTNEPPLEDKDKDVSPEKGAHEAIQNPV